MTMPMVVVVVVARVSSQYVDTGEDDEPSKDIVTFDVERSTFELPQ